MTASSQLEALAALEAAEPAPKRKGGKPRAVASEALPKARELIASGRTQAEVAKALGVNRTTLWRALKRIG